MLILLILVSSLAQAAPGRRLSREERKKARIERKMERVNKPWDERTRLQKKRDGKALIFLLLSAGVVFQAVMPKE